jgi:hypothetical protein
MTPPIKSLGLASKTNAGLAGAGGGTLLVLLADSLPESSTLKDALILASPSISVFVTSMWLWVQIRLFNYMQEKKLDVLVRQTKIMLKETLENSDTSDAHRETIRELLEELELFWVRRSMVKVKGESADAERRLQEFEARLNKTVDDKK